VNLRASAAPEVIRWPETVTTVSCRRPPSPPSLSEQTVALFVERPPSPLSHKMGSLLIVSPLLQSLDYDPPPITVPQSSTPTSARSGHYRPFSTLYTQSPYIEIRDKSPGLLKRHSSLGGLQAFTHMGIGFKDKAKAKKNLSPPLQVPDLIEINPSTPPRFPPPHHNVLQRPTTSLGAINPTPTLHRVKKKRSMVSLFTAIDPSPSSAFGSVPPLPGPHSLLSPPQSEDLSITNSISASFSKRTRFLDQHSDDHDSSEKFVPMSIWAKRHNMKLHPYHHEVPYMQAYDPILLEK